MRSTSYGDLGAMRTSSDAGDAYGDDAGTLALQMQYQQLLAQQGGAGMQLIAVPLQGGMQGLMQVGAPWGVVRRGFEGVHCVVLSKGQEVCTYTGCTAAACC